MGGPVQAGVPRGTARAQKRHSPRRQDDSPGDDVGAGSGETATPRRSKSKSVRQRTRSDAQSNAVRTEGGLRRPPGFLPSVLRERFLPLASLSLADLPCVRDDTRVSVLV